MYGCNRTFESSSTESLANRGRPCTDIRAPAERTLARVTMSRRVWSLQTRCAQTGRPLRTPLALRSSGDDSKAVPLRQTRARATVSNFGGKRKNTSHEAMSPQQRLAQMRRLGGVARAIPLSHHRLPRPRSCSIGHRPIIAGSKASRPPLRVRSSPPNANPLGSRPCVTACNGIALQEPEYTGNNQGVRT